MRITMWNWTGGYLGLLAARWVLFETVYGRSLGEASGNFFVLLGSSLRVPQYYAVGALVGFLVFPVVVELIQHFFKMWIEHRRG